jgi:hypothetical protein
MAACLTNIIKEHIMELIWLQETMKKYYNDSFSRSLIPMVHFLKVSVGVRQETFDVAM